MPAFRFASGKAAYPAGVIKSHGHAGETVVYVIHTEEIVSPLVKQDLHLESVLELVVGYPNSMTCSSVIASSTAKMMPSTRYVLPFAIT